MKESFVSTIDIRGHYELAHKEGIQFIYGFPNANSYHGLINKLNWKHDGYMRLYTFSVATIPAARLARKLPILNVVYRRYVKFILRFWRSDKHMLPNPLLEEGFAGILRDEQFFEYKRYSETYLLRVNQCQVWVSVQKQLLVGEIYPVDDNTIDSVVKSLRNIAQFLGCTEVVFSMSPGIQLDRFLSKRFQGIDYNPICYLKLNGEVPAERFRFSFCDCDFF
jgi:hypothetical protein